MHIIVFLGRTPLDIPSREIQRDPVGVHVNPPRDLTASRGVPWDFPERTPWDPAGPSGVPRVLTWHPTGSHGNPPSERILEHVMHSLDLVVVVVVLTLTL